MVIYCINCNKISNVNVCSNVNTSSQIQLPFSSKWRDWGLLRSHSDLIPGIKIFRWKGWGGFLSEKEGKSKHLQSHQSSSDTMWSFIGCEAGAGAILWDHDSPSPRMVWEWGSLQSTPHTQGPQVYILLNSITSLPWNEYCIKIHTIGQSYRICSSGFFVLSSKLTS